MSELRIGSVCSGYEGLGAAVRAVIGGELAWVADNDPGASKILACRFPGVPNLGDLTTVDWPAVEPVDVLIGGFPCTDISYAGRGEGIVKGNRSGLWYTIADAIGVLRPGLVLLENVAAIVARRPGLDVVLGSLAGLGFDAEWLCLRASDIGAPHGRNRWFAAAHPVGEQSERRGVAGILAGQERPAAGAGDQRERDGDAARGGAAPAADAGRHARPGDDQDISAAARRGHGAAQDADRAAGGERRQPAPGQEAGGWSRADAGGSGRAPAPDPERGGRDGWPPDQERGPVVGVAAARRGEGRDGGPAAADADGDGLAWGEERDGWPVLAEAISEQRRVDPLGRVLDWGVYERAIRRWEAILGRPAPAPTEPGRGGRPRLSPRLPEWMMGLPEGWVTDVPGLSRNDMLRALGNGVVPRQAAAAYSLLLVPELLAEGAA